MGRKNKIICGSLQVSEEVWDASKIINLVPHSSLLLGAFFFFYCHWLSILLSCSWGGWGVRGALQTGHFAMVTVIAGFVWASPHQPDVAGGFSSLWAAQGLRETLGEFQGRGGGPLAFMRGRGWQKAMPP